MTMSEPKLAVVIDDCEDVRRFLRSFLEYNGYEVRDYPSPLDSLCLPYSEQNYCLADIPCCDLMIVDYEMPGMNGFDFLLLQEKKNCKIGKVAMMSGSWNDDRLNRVTQSGFKAFPKPLPLDEFENWLKITDV